MKESTKWYLKFFKRLLSVTKYNAVVMYWLLPDNKNIDSLQFRLSLAHLLIEEPGSGVPHPAQFCQ
jgi:hypothetical protein